MNKSKKNIDFGSLCLDFGWTPKYSRNDMIDISIEESKEIGNELGVDWKQVILSEFHMGINVEREHGTIFRKSNITNDEIHLSALIALAHLQEGKHYYSYLKEMEEKMDKYDEKPSSVFL